MIFGIRAVIEALDAGKEVDKILIKKELTSDIAKELFAALHGKDVPVQRVPVEKINGLTQKNHQGVVAFMASIEYQRISSIIPALYEEGKTPLVMLLDGVTDVRNFGAIARTCECAGVNAVVVPTRGGAAANADAVKTSAGALHVLPVCRENSLEEVVKYLRDSGLKVVAATEKASKNYTEVSYADPVAIVMGAEDVGISGEVLRLCDELVAIPIQGTIASLNVSVAAGVLLYEAVRQRKG
jgi:23S rRNA (guanosine2251-2'-O)-methyltransferase